MHVWLAEAHAQRHTVLVSHFHPRNPSDSSKVVLAFSVADGRCTLTLLEADKIEWSRTRRVASLQGLLGLLPVGQDIFLVGVSSSEPVGQILSEQRIYRVSNVSFVCLTRRLQNDAALAQGVPDDAGAPDDPCAAIRKYMTGGSFYFSDGLHDITRRVQSSCCGAPSSDFHAQFLWNAFMLEPIETFRMRLDVHRQRILDQERFFLRVIQGYVGVYQVRACRLAVVSRLSSLRAGTRFHARGIDDEGNAANFVETETVLVAKDLVYSFTQVRGSVPVYWEQQGVQALNARIQITRSGAASWPGFCKHFDQLLHEYQRVFVLDLLGTRDVETLLAHAYIDHLRELDETRPIKYYNFDFHNVSRAVGGMEGVGAELDRLHNVQTQRQYYRYTLCTQGKMLERQSGVFRVNCFDCLDRTNVVEGLLSHAALRDFFHELRRHAQEPVCAQLAADTSLPAALWQAHRDLWAGNGDALSNISTGTGSLNSNFVRTGTRKGLTGLISDAAKSASRLYVNHFQDQTKQVAIDMLLGNRSGQQHVELYDPRYARVSEMMARRWHEYASVHDVQVWVGTYNACAQSPAGIDLSVWLYQTPEPPDVVAVILEEIVPLNAQQMLQSARDEQAAWQRALSTTLHRTGIPYEALRNELLFGTALFVYVKSSLLPHIRRVEGTTKKTGFRGMSGNKGAVAVRFELFDTSICMVGSHLSSGSNNKEERNADYHAIARDLVFTRGRTIDSHDHIFWAGDLNYRIALPSAEDVRDLASRRQLEPLLLHDQLTDVRMSSQAFAGYNEMPIRFPPTYKYDVGSDIYDTSEKLRPPAWTDRVLFKCTRPTLHIHPIAYDCAPIRASDHRPVGASLNVGICTLDTAYRDELYESLVNGMIEQDKKEGESSLARPPPSSDTAQWWNQAHQPPLSPALGDPSVRGNPFEQRDPAPTPTLPTRQAVPSPPPIPPRPGKAP